MSMAARTLLAIQKFARQMQGKRCVAARVENATKIKWNHRRESFTPFHYP
eukprot:TRINITY_DN753_c0_g1_i1.p2 TRINITY_DN753_c0_g1~~TRINITY_DN753_c0_g1_i1.p2  ORF type:complete len:50 (+),score=6.23 TRINITY_DN753_c0_g1_i1:182-331(+)